jgi:hypothetical protein
MGDGTYKNIDDLVVGDVIKTVIIPTYPNGENPALWYPASVWSLPDSEIGGTTYEDTNVQVISPLNAIGYYKLNNRVSFTGDHFVFVKRDELWQFMRAWNIVIGDTLLAENLTEEVVETIDIVNEQVTVFAIIVGPNDLFIGSGIITHNGVVKNSAY